MARNKISYTHGDGGTEPSSSLDFQSNERPDSQHFDWFWDTVISKLNTHVDELDELDSDDDGIVDGADQLQFPQDGGIMTAADMAVTSSPAAGTEMSYVFEMDNKEAFKVHSEANGSGGLQALEHYWFNSSGAQTMSIKESGNVEIPRGNLSLDTGQSIKDESGGRRIRISPTQTGIYDEGSNPAILLNSGNQMRYNAFTTTPWQIYDKEGSFPAVEYNTDTSVGELRTLNAFVNVQESGSPSNAGLHFRYDSGNNWGQVLPRDANGNNQELFLSGSPVHINSGNLRLATGQYIEDGSGNERVGLFSGGTYIRSQEGAGRPFVQVADGEIKFDVNSGQNINIRDTGGGFDAVQYLQSDSGPGVLRTLNAGFAVESDGRSASSIGIHFRYDSSNNRGFIQSQDLVNNNAQDLYLQALKGGTLRLRSTSGTIDTTSDGSTPADIRVGTGQSIIDGSGTQRLQFASNLTQVNSENGNRVFRARTDGNGDTRISAYSNSNVDIYDEAGNCTGVQYIASSSKPGTFELRNADLFVNQTKIEFANATDDTTFQNDLEWPDQGGGQVARVYSNYDGEIVGQDDSGNTTVLT